MMKLIIAFAIICAGFHPAAAQTTVLYSKTAVISFFSKTAMENIDAKNSKATSVWDMSSGKLEFSVLMKGFEFNRALMQEHFNEDYVESDKFPKATFKGAIADYKLIGLDKDASYNVKVNGALTIHGVTKQVIVPAVITVKNGVASATAGFTVPVADYNIKIPSLVADKINKQITINVTVPEYKVLASR